MKIIKVGEGVLFQSGTSAFTLSKEKKKETKLN